MRHSVALLTFFLYSKNSLAFALSEPQAKACCFWGNLRLEEFSVCVGVEPVWAVSNRDGTVDVVYAFGDANTGITVTVDAGFDTPISAMHSWGFSLDVWSDECLALGEEAKQFRMSRPCELVSNPSCREDDSCAQLVRCD